MCWRGVKSTGSGPFPALNLPPHFAPGPLCISILAPESHALTPDLSFFLRKEPCSPALLVEHEKPAVPHLLCLLPSLFTAAAPQAGFQEVRQQRRGVLEKHSAPAASGRRAEALQGNTCLRPAAQLMCKIAAGRQVGMSHEIHDTACPD